MIVDLRPDNDVEKLAESRRSSFRSQTTSSMRKAVPPSPRRIFTSPDRNPMRAITIASPTASPTAPRETPRLSPSGFEMQSNANCGKEEQQRFHTKQKGKAFRRPDLRSIGFFKACSRSFLEILGEQISWKLFVKDDIILKKAVSCSQMYILFRGEVDVVLDGDVKLSFADGSVFGEVDAGVARLLATVRAKMLCQCGVIERSAFLSTVKKFPDDASILQAETRQYIDDLQKAGLAVAPVRQEWWNIQQSPTSEASTRVNSKEPLLAISRSFASSQEAVSSTRYAFVGEVDSNKSRSESRSYCSFADLDIAVKEESLLAPHSFEAKRGEAKRRQGVDNSPSRSEALTTAHRSADAACQPGRSESQQAKLERDAAATAETEILRAAARDEEKETDETSIPRRPQVSNIRYWKPRHPQARAAPTAVVSKGIGNPPGTVADVLPVETAPVHCDIRVRRSSKTSPSLSSSSPAPSSQEDVQITSLSLVTTSCAPNNDAHRHCFSATPTMGQSGRATCTSRAQTYKSSRCLSSLSSPLSLANSQRRAKVAALWAEEGSIDKCSLSLSTVSASSMASALSAAKRVVQGGVCLSKSELVTPADVRKHMRPTQASKKRVMTSIHFRIDPRARLRFADVLPFGQ